MNAFAGRTPFSLVIQLNLRILTCQTNYDYATITVHVEVEVEEVERRIPCRLSGLSRLSDLCSALDLAALLQS